MKTAIAAAQGQIQMVSLLPDSPDLRGFTGREGNVLKWIDQPPNTLTGSVQVLGAIQGGIHATGSMFEYGRLTHFACDANVTGMVQLRLMPKSYRPSLFDAKIRADVNGDVIIVDGVQGHGSFELTISRPLGCSVIVETGGEIGWHTARVEIRGDAENQIEVSGGLPWKYERLQDGTLKIRIDPGLTAGLQESIAKAHRDGKLNLEVQKQVGGSYWGGYPIS